MLQQSIRQVQFPFCNVTVARDLFTPAPFVASPRLVRTNRLALRWGGASNDLVTLLEGTPEEQTDYIVGLVTTSVVVALVCATWTLFLILAKCLGYRQCGFLCGRFVRPTLESVQNQTQKKKNSHTTNPTPRWWWRSGRWSSSSSPRTPPVQPPPPQPTTLDHHPPNDNDDNDPWLWDRRIPTAPPQLPPPPSNEEEEDGGRERIDPPPAVVPILSQQDPAWPTPKDDDTPNFYDYDYSKDNSSPPQKDHDDHEDEKNVDENVPNHTIINNNINNKEARIHDYDDRVPPGMFGEEEEEEGIVMGEDDDDFLESQPPTSKNLVQQQQQQLEQRLPPTTTAIHEDGNLVETQQEELGGSYKDRALILYEQEQQSQRQELQRPTSLASCGGGGGSLDCETNHMDPSRNNILLQSIPQTPTPHEATIEWRRVCRSQERRKKRVCIVLGIACLCICVSAVLFCYHGTVYVHDTLDSVASGLQKIQTLCRGATTLIETYQVRQTNTTLQLQDMLTNLNGLCPKVRQELCQSLEPEPTNCNFTDLPPVIATSLPRVFELVYQSQTYINDQLDNVQNDLQDLIQDIDTVLESNTSLDWLFWIAFAFMIALSLCCLVLVLGLVQSHVYGHSLHWLQQWFRHQVVVPLFCVLAGIAFVFALAFIIAAVAASDWCINSPDAKVTYLLDQVFQPNTPTTNNNPLDSIIYTFAKFYVNSCQDEYSPIQPSQQSSRLQTGLHAVADFADTMGSLTVEEWSAVCGQDLTVLQTFSELIQQVLCLLTLTMEDVNRFFWCRYWSPIYTTFMHQAVCTNVRVTCVCIVPRMTRKR